MKLEYRYKKNNMTEITELEVSKDMKFSKEVGERVCSEMVERIKGGWILEAITIKE